MQNDSRQKIEHQGQYTVVRIKILLASLCYTQCYPFDILPNRMNHDT